MTLPQKEKKFAISEYFGTDSSIAWFSYCSATVCFSCCWQQSTAWPGGYPHNQCGDHRILQEGMNTAPCGMRTDSQMYLLGKDGMDDGLFVYI